MLLQKQQDFHGNSIAGGSFVPQAGPPACRSQLPICRISTVLPSGPAQNRSRTSGGGKAHSPARILAWPGQRAGDNKNCSGLVLAAPSACSRHLPGRPSIGSVLAMKPIRIVLIPTRSRPLNIFLGLLLLLAALLLFLALATYRASDPSSIPPPAEAARNWIGLFGAWLSDLLLQSLGLAAFLLPLWLGGIGWTWMRSRSGGCRSCAGSAHCWLWSLCPPSLPFCPGNGAGSICFPSRVSSAVSMAGSSGRLSQYSGRLAGGRRPGRRRTLLCLRIRLLGRPRSPPIPLAASPRLERPLAQLARGARRNPRRAPRRARSPPRRRPSCRRS